MVKKKNNRENKLTQHELDSQIKTFLQNGGKVVKIPIGKSGFPYVKTEK